MSKKENEEYNVGESLLLDEPYETCLALLPEGDRTNSTEIYLYDRVIVQCGWGGGGGALIDLGVHQVIKEIDIAIQAHGLAGCPSGQMRVGAS